MISVLVFGWYSHFNLGDELFKVAFQKLFPDISFTFVDQIKFDALKEATAVFIGGGSFLFSDMNISQECLNLLKTKSIFYIGVGAETDIHPIHIELMRVAKLIALRSNIGLDKVKPLNTNTIVIPDIVYALDFNSNSRPIEKSVLIIPNISVVPNNRSPHWMHNSWDHFKFEFSQFVDYLIDEKCHVRFVGMCKSNKNNDDWAATEIINAMMHRSSSLVLDNEITDVINDYEIVITQRFHGIILSEITRTPYIAIYHHDKLKTSHLNEGIFMSYYGSSKQDYIDQYNSARMLKLNPILPIEGNSFESLVERVNASLH
jgi:polysaccharide pyruvyl transferase WcaK-like protein